MQEKMKPVRIAIIENNITSTLSMRKKLTQVLMEKGFEVTIITTGTKNDIEAAQKLGFHVIDIGTSVRNPLEILKYMWQLKNALQQIQATVCLTFTIRPAIWGNIVTRLLHIPTITNITGIGPLFERNDITYRGARWLYKFVLSKTKKIIFQNEDDKKLFLSHKFATEKRVLNVPGSGIDYNDFIPFANTNTDGKFHFIFISRLIKDKGIPEYIEACKLIRKEFSNVACDVLGPFWSQNLKDNTITSTEVNTWVNEGIINYLGSTTDVKPFIANTNCVVLPSYREGTSNVLLETSSMEKPSITCNVTGCKEVVADGYNGFLCEPQNAISLYNAMKKILSLSKEEIEVMGKNGRKKVIKEFDKQIVVDAYMHEIEILHK